MITCTFSIGPAIPYRPSSQPTAYPTKHPYCVPTVQPSRQPRRQPSVQPTKIPMNFPSNQPTKLPTCQPSRQPRREPSVQPTKIPINFPSNQPTKLPTCQPTCNPLNIPSSQPSKIPSGQPFQSPTRRPSAQPSYQPTKRPVRKPSSQPTTSPKRYPTKQPLRRPTSQPSIQPRQKPTLQPTRQPSSQPSTQPYRRPSIQPSFQPKNDPTIQPSAQPNSRPTVLPLVQPSKQPFLDPSMRPTQQPSRQPVLIPSSQPNHYPSNQPSKFPSYQPSRQPFRFPTRQPTFQPAAAPTHLPSVQPSRQPLKRPSCQPSSQPSRQPISVPTRGPSFQPGIKPSRSPSKQPSLQPFRRPTRQPSYQPFQIPKSRPSIQPSRQPSKQPLRYPSRQPSRQPTKQPTRQPSKQPLHYPSPRPSKIPSYFPTFQPTMEPSCIPSRQPDSKPSHIPSSLPTMQPSNHPVRNPSSYPSQQPFRLPTIQPSYHPSCIPSLQPMKQPTCQPADQPTNQPSKQPTRQPSRQPLRSPTQQPQKAPSQQPVRKPSRKPTRQPLLSPSQQPVRKPSRSPTKQPFCRPTLQPGKIPSRLPSFQPLRKPTAQPRARPSIQPSSQPNIKPTRQPLNRPSIQPTAQPYVNPSSQPKHKPTSQPLPFPSKQPVSFPTMLPSRQPGGFPTKVPSSQPKSRPSYSPTAQPVFRRPTVQPSRQPNRKPTIQPSRQPSVQPNRFPSRVPSRQPLRRPTSQPSKQPARRPTRQMTYMPTSQPLSCPTAQPSCISPSNQPTTLPSLQPFLSKPTAIPVVKPSSLPTLQPKISPTSKPSKQPRKQPSCKPTSQPLYCPSGQPSVQPTRQPSTQPSLTPFRRPSLQPALRPSRQPNNLAPTRQPRRSPSRQPGGQRPSSRPTRQPSRQPSAQPVVKHPSSKPTLTPSGQPTRQPVNLPSRQPSRNPTFQPSHKPTRVPSIQPNNAMPTSQPSRNPSCQPKTKPSKQPSIVPSTQPVFSPSMTPTVQPFTNPSKTPTIQPVREPSRNPTRQPSKQPLQRRPTAQPALNPTRQPSRQPSKQPSSQPTRQPTSQPSKQPLNRPTRQPSLQPRRKPSRQPTVTPSLQSTVSPTMQPQRRPTYQPSSNPYRCPTSQPLTTPTCQPTQQPFQRRPTYQPQRRPTRQPSSQPIRSPSRQPVRRPTVLPTSQPLLHAPSQQPKQSPTQQPVHLTPSLQPSAQPVHPPTVQPLRYPTTQPSRIPVRRPSSKPSQIPSVQPVQKPSIQPSVSPSKLPLTHPSKQPSRVPSEQPTIEPYIKPSEQPYSEPTTQPSHYPTTIPTKQPSNYPSYRPSIQPTKQPVRYPSRQPSRQPSQQPRIRPSRIPISKPSSQPTCTPLSRPSSQPNRLRPSRQPLRQPSKQPIRSPSRQPSIQPYISPKARPTRQPRRRPSSQPVMVPTISPSRNPTARPSNFPKQLPTCQPSKQPQRTPSRQPNRKPSRQPSRQPTFQPRRRPTRRPSSQPSYQPILKPSQQPRRAPTAQPLTSPSRQPFSSPSYAPIRQPSPQPTCRPSFQPQLVPSKQPFNFPTVYPSIQPTVNPSAGPSHQPTTSPTRQPTKQPQRSPSKQPSRQPTRRPFVKRPSNQPSRSPTKQPNFKPSRQPSKQPISRPSVQPRFSPTFQPTLQPTYVPSLHPSIQPSRKPTSQPFYHPTRIPTNQPTSLPFGTPTKQPRCNPSNQPSMQPKDLPSSQPQNLPSKQPSRCPTSLPSTQPYRYPSRLPSAQPAGMPTCKPKHVPTRQPTGQPVIVPSKRPVGRPTLQPTKQPSTQPTRRPRITPSCCPTKQPFGKGPTAQPIGRMPSKQPSGQPSQQPDRVPTSQPVVSQPTTQPIQIPSVIPSAVPSKPSSQPSAQPTYQPTNQYSRRPSSQPLRTPSSQPSLKPSRQIFCFPSSQPSKQPVRKPTLQPNRNPSSAPTRWPSRQPSFQPKQKPSTEPRSRPTRQPSTQPICKPTRQPSAQPSMRPTTSNPTSLPTEDPAQNSISIIPTPTDFKLQNPTSQPTIGSTYLNSTVYKAFQKTLSSISKQTNSTTFEYFYYKGQVKDGSCRSWQSFADDSLRISSDIAVYSHIAIDFASSNFISTQTGNLHATCSTQSTVSSIVNSVQQKTSFSANCNGNLWRVISCSNSVILCVNCKNTCSRTPNCPGLSFSLNPCGSCRTDAAQMVVVRFEYTRPVLYPQFVPASNTTATSSPLIVSTNAKYFIVSANISQPGYVYCAAIPTSVTTNVITALTIKLRGVTTVVTSMSGDRSPVQINITNLFPETAYDVICYTEDFAMHAMPLELALMTTTRAVTSCCKRIEIVNLDAYIPQHLSSGASWDNQLQVIQLNSPPIVDTTVTLSIIGCNGVAAPDGDSTWPVAQPSQFTFAPNFTSFEELTGSFRVRGSRMDSCYTLSATATGGVFTGISANFSIRNVRVKPPAPLMTSVSFSADGTSLLIYFDSETDCGSINLAFKSVNCLSSFTCSSIVQFGGSNNSLCYWETNKLLVARLNLETSQFSSKTLSSLLPSIGQSCSLKPNILRPLCNPPVDCSTVSTSPSTTLAIQSPLEPVIPFPRVIVPSTVYPCTDISVDPSASTGSGGRPWHYIRWDAYGVGLYSLSQITFLPTISRNINANYGGSLKTASAFLIDSDLLSSDGLTSGNYSSLRLSLTLTNFMLQSAIATTDVRLVLQSNVEGDGFTPQVGIHNAYNGVVYPWQRINFLAVVTTIFSSQCNTIELNKNATSILKYSWKVFVSDGNGSIQFITIPSKSSGPTFSIPPYFLKASTTYIVQLFTAISNGTFVSKFINYPAVTAITTGRSGVQAVISGGDTRSTSLFNDIHIDASSSYDIDFPRASGTILSYLWTCSVVSPAASFGGDCFPASSRVDIYNPVVHIPAGVLSVGSCNISVLVFRVNPDSTITSESAYCILNILNSEKIVTVQIQRDGISNSASSPFKFNPGDNIFFVGTISAMQRAGYGNWTVMENNFVSSSLQLLSPSLKAIPPGNSIFQFAVSTTNSLSAKRLTFQLSVCYSSTTTVCASSQLIITRNDPPRGGVLSVSPPLGTAMITEFKISTVFWSDDVEDYPLQYLMGYYVQGIDSLNIVKNYNFLSSVSSFLGSGLPGTYYSLQCIVSAMDSYGGYGNTSTPATVTPATISQAEIMLISIDAIETTFTSTDHSSFYPTVSAALSSINSADCSSVPVPCYKLNRMECFSTLGTCGPCLSGFTGRIGDSNIACNASMLTTGSPCVGDAYCATGLCSNRICSEPLKSCSNNCNGNGLCGFKNYNGLSIKNCPLSDGSCFAVCSCNANFKGKDCSFSTPQYQSLVSYRESLCANLLAVVVNEQAQDDTDTSDKITNRANTIQTILSDYSQISKNALDFCSRALNLTIIRNPTNACYQLTASVVMQAFASIVYTANNLSPTNVDAINGIAKMVTVFSTGCQNQMISGQIPLQFSYDSLRNFIATVDVSVGSYSFTMPQSSWYTYLNIQSPQVKIVFPTNSSSAVQSISISSTTFSRPNLTFANMSSSLQLKLAVNAIIANSATRRLSTSSASISITSLLNLPNKSPVHFIKLPTSAFSFHCQQISSKPYKLNGTCPNGQIIENMVCPGSARGRFDVKCPGYATFPKCKIWQQTSFGEISSCRVKNFTSYSTECECKFTSSPSSIIQFEVATDLASQRYGDYPVTSFQLYTSSSVSKVNRSYRTAVWATLYTLVLIFLVGCIRFAYVGGKESKVNSKPSDAVVPSPVRSHSNRTVQSYLQSVYFESPQWRIAVWKMFQIKHPLLRLYFWNLNSKGFDSLSDFRYRTVVHWVIAAASILSTIFYSIVVLRIYGLLDDGAYRTCGNIAFESDCRRNQKCSFDSTSGVCNYSYSPSVEMTIQLILTITPFTITNANIVKIVIESLVTNYSALMNAIRQLRSTIVPVVISDIVTSSEGIEVEVWASNDRIQTESDEFVSLQSKKKTLLLLAARLAKLNHVADFSLPLDESSNVWNIWDDIMNKDDKEEKRNAYRHVDSVAGRVSYLLYYLFDPKIYPFNRWMILRRVSSARKSTDSLVQLLRTMDDSDKENLLVKVFSIQFFSGFKRLIMERLLITDTSRQQRMASLPFLCLHIVGVFSLLGLWSFMIFYIYSQFVNLRSSLTIQLFIIIVLSAYFEDIWFFQSLSIWVEDYLPKFLVKDTVEQQISALSSVGRVVLARSSGFMTFSNSFGKFDTELFFLFLIIFFRVLVCCLLLSV